MESNKRKEEFSLDDETLNAASGGSSRGAHEGKGGYGLIVPTGNGEYDVYDKRTERMIAKGFSKEDAEIAAANLAPEKKKRFGLF